MVRINKYLAQSHLGSRRKADELIKTGLVFVNGIVCTELSTQIDPEKDRVTYKNKLVKPDEKKIFVMLNKPKNYIVTKEDEFKRKTIYSLLPEFAKDLNSVGRLDFESEGLLILTNDGDIANSIIHPSAKLPKTYQVAVNGLVGNEELKKLREGIELDGKKTLPAKVFIKNTFESHTDLKITIYEGRNRQIRRMIEAINLSVTKLKRIQIGEILLGKLPTGMWRFLTDEEVLYLVLHSKKKKKKEKNENRVNRSK